VLIDTFHSNIEEKSIPEALLALGPYLKHIHASENDRGVPGRGHVDFPGIVQALRRSILEAWLAVAADTSPEALSSPLSDEASVWEHWFQGPETTSYGFGFTRSRSGSASRSGWSPSK
jgi:D-psicose/D-tagatose/L-ribulose 3-epimerase